MTLKSAIWSHNHSLPKRTVLADFPHTAPQYSVHTSAPVYKETYTFGFGNGFTFK